MKRRILARLTALALALLLTLVPAHALTLEQARELLTTHYIDDVPESVLSQPTIQDMLTALSDPYTTYFTPEEYAAFNSTMADSSVVGIGVSSTMAEDGLLIEHVYDSSPAQRGGLRKGDRIVAVDGKATAGAALELAATWLRGEAGTPVSITYLRDGAEHTITLIRQEVIIPATTTQVEAGHIGLIECTTFGDETLQHFTDGITQNAGVVDRWIVDLRSNGGGAVNAAIQSAGLFTGAGVLAYLRDKSGQYGAYGTNESSATLYPVVVLTSPATASASELFAAAVRDRNAGICVGERTYGKGVAQQVLDDTQLPDYFPDGDAIKITAYRFYAPSGNTTDTVGIIPHLLVPQSIAEQVAVLLCASNPSGDTAGLLRLDMGWRWYIDLETALAPENQLAFTCLLEAIPSNARLLAGTGGADGWAETSPAEVAGFYGLDYQSRGFDDTADSPYSQQIDLLATYGIVLGDGSGAFHPEDSLTRAQLCALLYQALGSNAFPVSESRFSDVSLNSWYGQAVNVLAERGLVTGVGGNQFRPDDPVTHEQLITIMGRLSKYLNLYLDSMARSMPEDAAAAEKLTPYAAWSRNEVWLLALSQQGLLGDAINLLWAELDEIDPQAAATREEAACLVYTIFSYTGILPA